MYVGINSDILCVSLLTLSLSPSLRLSYHALVRRDIIDIFNLFDVITLSIFEIPIFVPPRLQTYERV